ncbi:MAG: hypothetical protein NE328_18810 [Lentisphaeraceae bacterium]|nr:hypothetical protein [Lentisphaeraceae bacterium]
MKYSVNNNQHSSSGSSGFQPVEKYSVFSSQYSVENSQERCTPVRQKPSITGKMPVLLGVLLSILLTTSISAQKLEFVGVLGNSGEAGSNLSKFSANRTKKFDGGLGVHYDRFGTLWSTAGLDQVNRYTLDGRLVATYKLPLRKDHYTNKMIDCGDELIFLLDQNLYSLSILAKPGETAKELPLKVKLIGHSNKAGLFPALSSNNEVILIKTDGTIAKTVTKLKHTPYSLFMTEDDNIHMVINGYYEVIKDGKLVEQENPQLYGGDSMQKIDNNWYSHAWHGTLKRLDDTISPDPGIVLGGSSGYFIGHLIGNYELSKGTAISKINNNLFAIGGVTHVIHLMEWKEKETRFEIVRRIGPLSEVRGALALDEDGRILVPYGNWNWNDAPDTPLINGTAKGPNGQTAFMDNGIAVSPSLLYGNLPAWSYGKISEEMNTVHDGSKQFNFKDGCTATTILRKDNHNVAYYVGPEGIGYRLQVNPLGKPEKTLGTFKMTTKSPVKKWTTFAKINNDKVLAAGDGSVIEFDTSDTNEWKETKRWKNFSSDSFGNEIHINIDKEYFWVADTERHRVLCFDHQFKLITSYGNKDAAGNDFLSFNSPTTVFGNNNRFVVYDQGNQRLMKFEVK